MTDTIPLNKIQLSPRNARKTNAAEDIESLAASIQSMGLLQNLVVSPSIEKEGIFEVDAGGRRFRALRLLVKRKVLPANWPVPVNHVALDSALEVSLEENLQRIAMNPADEVEAFAAIVAKYEAGGMMDEAERIANCARRFDKTVRYVAQRLALAALAPEILSALRDRRITIEAAHAYAGHPDHKLQLRVFTAEEKKGNWGHAPKSVRDAIAGKTYPTDHKAVRYVGIDAYVAAGGRIQPDLFFAGEERDVLLDPAIVDRLCEEKVSAEAQALAQADGWLDGAVNPWTGPSWQEAKPPKGYAMRYQVAANVPAEQRANCIAVYRLLDDGSGLEQIQRYFGPAAPAAAPTSTYKPETPEQQAARYRRNLIAGKAALLAAPSLAGSAFEGRAEWEEFNQWNAPEPDDDGDYILALYVAIPAAEVEARMAEAEQSWEAEQAAKAEAEEAERAATESVEQPAEAV